MSGGAAGWNSGSLVGVRSTSGWVPRTDGPSGDACARSAELRRRPAASRPATGASGAAPKGSFASLSFASARRRDRGGEPRPAAAVRGARHPGCAPPASPLQGDGQDRRLRVRPPRPEEATSSARPAGYPFPAAFTLKDMDRFVDQRLPVGFLVAEHHDIADGRRFGTEPVERDAGHRPCRGAHSLKGSAQRRLKLAPLGQRRAGGLRDVGNPRKPRIGRSGLGDRRLVLLRRGLRIGHFRCRCFFRRRDFLCLRRSPPGDPTTPRRPGCRGASCVRPAAKDPAPSWPSSPRKRGCP